MNMAEFEAPTPVLARDGHGRPMVVPPGGGAAIAYTRCTTFAGKAEDYFKLGQWEIRQAMLGLADRPDLLLAVAANRDDRDELDKIGKQAKEAAAASAKATTGSALHKFTEQDDRGELGDLKRVPVAYRPDILAYREMKQRFRVDAIEQFGVHDGLRVGGTWDRIYVHNGRRYIADLKTGNVQYGHGKIAIQLAIYSRCEAYDPGTYERTPINVDQDWGIVINLVAGSGALELYWADLRAGWAATEMTKQLIAWRGRRNLLVPFADGTVPMSVDPPPVSVPPLGPREQLLDRIDNAPTVGVLTAIWRQHQSLWDDGLTARAAARKAAISGSSE